MKKWQLFPKKLIKRILIRPRKKYITIDIETQPLSGSCYIIGCDFANGKDHYTIFKIVNKEVEIIKQT
jgi:hypothetical protein